MNEGGGRVIEAAGGVLWRPGSEGVEIALVHRPKYDDWSLPKGKLTPAEHPVLGGLREVAEETGYSATPGRPLGELLYLKDGLPKRVRYWAMRVAGGEFVASDEVDELRWLPVEMAAEQLPPERDRGILLDFAAQPASTWPVVLVRHASAGDRDGWPGEDDERPLDDRGHREAEALADVLVNYDLRRLLAADVVRCLDTLAPLARRTGLEVEPEPLFSEHRYAKEPERVDERFRQVASGRTAVAVSSQGGPVPGLAARLCASFGVPTSFPPTPKAGYVVVHLHDAASVGIAGVEAFSLQG